jgi:hypothetical protein
MGTLRVLGSRGDSQVRWDEANEASVSKARKAFERYLAFRFLAFSTPPSGGDATLIRNFDPEADEIILTRPLIGG